MSLHIVRFHSEWRTETSTKDSPAICNLDSSYLKLDYCCTTVPGGSTYELYFNQHVAGWDDTCFGFFAWDKDRTGGGRDGNFEKKLKYTWYITSRLDEWETIFWLGGMVFFVRTCF